MANFSKTTWLIVCITFFSAFLVIITGFFGYQWWQGEEELRKQTREKESLVSELKEIKKEMEIKEKTFFIECKEIKIPKEEIIGIYLLGTVEKDWSRRMWNLIVIDPEGYGVGGWEFPMESGGKALMSTGMPYDVNEDGLLDDAVRLDRAIGDYLIIAALGPEVSLADTYGIQLNNLVLAKNIPYSENFLDRVYILRQTETGIIPIVPASVGCQF